MIKKIFNSEYFRNEKKDNYFEGYYYKIETKKNEIISFIPGISKNENDTHAFIQIINNINNKTYYLKYDISKFKYSNNPFYISIEDNYFSLDKIVLNIKHTDINIKGNIKINNITKIKRSIYAPNIMGPFSYLPFLECNHGIISLHHNYEGTLSINNKDLDLGNSLGYIEKDWGTSFPEKYIWIHGTSNNTTLFTSIATIPFTKFKFTGFLCTLYLNDKEYRFTTYNFSKIKPIKKEDNKYHIELKKRNYILIIDTEIKDGQILISPENGTMKNKIKESLNSITTVKLYKNKKLIYQEKYNPSLIEDMW